MSTQQQIDAVPAIARPPRAPVVRGSSKRSLLVVHRWIGAGLGLLLLLQGLSGATLTFRDSLEPLLHPELSVRQTGERLPVQRMIDAVTAEDVGTIDRVEFPDNRHQAVLFKMTSVGDAGKWLAAVDPYSGAVVRQGGLMTWPFEFFLELHEHFLAGETGEWIIGFEGIALLFMGISGLVVWFPGRARLASGFTVVRGRSAATFWRSLHRSAGGAIAVVLLFSATTGTLMVFKDAFREVLRLGGEVVAKPTAKVEKRPGKSLVSIDDIIAKARMRHGATDVRELRFTDGEGRGVHVYLVAEASSRPLATKQIAYDRYSGDELGNYIAGQNPAGNEIVDWLFPLHSGAAIGGLLRVITFLGGLGLIVLSGTGLWLWWKPRLTRRKAAAS